MGNWVIFQQSSTTYDNNNCQSGSNYNTVFDGAIVLVQTNNTKNCGGTMTSTFGKMLSLFHLRAFFPPLLFA
jgi:hypothetical protein